MGKRRFRAPQVRRFLVSMVLTASVAGLLSRQYGEPAVHWVSDLPATASGWQFLGWLLGGPPLLLAAMAWNDRDRFSVEQRRLRATAYGAWLGLGGFFVPALSGDSYAIFGNVVTVGNELAFGWTCGAVGNLAAVAFATGIGVLRRQAAPDGEAPESALAIRFVEIAWTVLLLVTMLFALYGAELGFQY